MQFSPLQHELLKKRVHALGYKDAAEASGLSIAMICYMMANKPRLYRIETIDRAAMLVGLPPFFFHYLGSVDIQKLLKDPQKHSDVLLETISQSFSHVYDSIKPTA